MSRHFNGTTSQYIARASNIVGSPPSPCTISGWFRTAAASVQTIFSIADASSNTSYLRLILRGEAGDTVQAEAREGAGASLGVATTTTSYTENEWQHACGVFTSSTLRAAFLNGGGKGTNTVNRAPANLDRSAIGLLRRSSQVHGHNGELAEVGVWDVALSDNNVKSLAAGVSPLHVRPDGLQAYWTCYGQSDPEPSYVLGGTHNADVVGATLDNDHPYVAPPFGFDSYIPIGAAAAPGLAFQPLFNRHTPTYLRM